MSTQWPWRQILNNQMQGSQPNRTTKSINSQMDQITGTRDTTVTASVPSLLDAPTEFIDTERSKIHFECPPTVTISDNNRVFNPGFSSCWTGDTSPATIVRYNPIYNVSNLLYSIPCAPDKLQAMESSIAIFIDGNGKDFGTPKPKASYGIYFGPGSKFNEKGPIPSTWKPTLQLADLAATIEALKVVKEKCMSNLAMAVYLKHVVIATDADYTVKAMTDMIKTWRGNGFRTALGGEIVNKDILQEVDRHIVELENQGIEVAFWKITRQNAGFKMAEKLSLEALGQ